jgi:hypothetical protein
MPPQVGAALYEEECEELTPGQMWTLLLSSQAGGPSQIRSAGGVAGADLCIQTDDASQPDFRWPRSRRVYLALCNSTEPRQQWLIETTSVDGEDRSLGPIQGVDGLVLAAYGDSDASDTAIIGFPFQGGSNAVWSYSGVTGAIEDPLSGTCLTACAPLSPI